MPARRRVAPLIFHFSIRSAPKQLLSFSFFLFFFIPVLRCMSMLGFESWFVSLWLFIGIEENFDNGNACLRIGSW